MKAPLAPPAVPPKSLLGALEAPPERAVPKPGAAPALTPTSLIAPVALVPALGARLGYRPSEVAALLAVSTDLVESWVASGAVPLVAVPGKVRIIPAWWVAQVVGGPGCPPARADEHRRVPKRVTVTTRPVTSPPAPLPSVHAGAPRTTRTRRESHRAANPAPWAVPPTVDR